jgi:hypothetical protein
MDTYAGGGENLIFIFQVSMLLVAIAAGVLVFVFAQRPAYQEVRPKLVAAGLVALFAGIGAFFGFQLFTGLGAITGCGLGILLGLLVSHKN